MNIPTHTWSYTNVMQKELNRRTFLALLGVTTVAITGTVAGRIKPVPSRTYANDLQHRCYFSGFSATPPSLPKTAAITYLHDC